MKVRYSIKKLNNDPEPIGWLAKIVPRQIGLILAWFFANFTAFTPNQISLMAFFLSFFSAFLFLKGYLIYASLVYLLVYTLDFVDGSIARAKKQTSKFGAYLENYLGNVAFVFNSFALTLGQYLRTNQSVWIIMWPLVYISLTFHFWESNLVSRIVGEDFRDIVKGNKSLKKSNGLLRVVFRLRNFLIKHKLIEPINRADIFFVCFFIAPIYSVFFGYLREIILVCVVLMVLKQFFWFVYYRMILKSIDGSDAK